MYCPYFLYGEISDEIKDLENEIRALKKIQKDLYSL
jgi:hypothetical protein